MQDIEAKTTSSKLRLEMPANVRYAITVVILLLCLNGLLRTVFLVYNQDQAHAMSWADILTGYTVGFRFDLATILLFNGVILFFLVLPLAVHRRPVTYKICNVLLIIANVPILLVNAVDVVYYGYAEKRLTHEFFTTRNDFGSFKPSLLAEYWWLFVIFFVVVGLLYKVLNFFALRFVQSGEANRRPSRRWFWSFGFLVCMYMGMHGGFQTGPLSISKAYIGDSFFSGSMGLNSAFTILSAVDWQPEAMNQIPEEEAVATTRAMLKHSWDLGYLRNDYPLLRQTTFSEPERHYNVVFLIIESLNAKDVGVLTGAKEGRSLTPNLDTLARHARVYDRYFANGTRSVESLPALLNSIPDIFDRPTIGSHFMQNTHYGLPMMLKERGYESNFFCGSRNGTLGFDKYTAISGINRYYGMNEYPYSERDFDGYWGCADLPYMQWMSGVQNKMKEPFLSVFFSLSNHHPFVLPKENTDDIAKLSLSRMQKTVIYTDRAIGNYFKTVMQEEWAKNTIFILTGDHCFHENSDPNRTFMENFHVPLFLIGPEIEPGIDSRIGNHVSIMPTLIEHLRLRTMHSSTGVSLLGEGPEAFAINNLMNVVTLAQGDLALSTSFDRLHSICRYTFREWEKAEVGTVSKTEQLKLEYKLRCLYQVYHNTRIRNKMQFTPWHSLSEK